MITKNTIKQIRNLEQRKFRRLEGKFVAEGNKLVEDNLSAMRCHQLIATEEWFIKHPSARSLAEECFEVTHDVLEKISLLQTPQDVLGVFYIPQHSLQIPKLNTKKLTLALDTVQDPGNLGTIIRLCDWFGIKDIYCSENTVDCYSPKVVQATMGAIARVHIHYLNLKEFLREAQEEIPIYGTFLEGENIYKANLSPNGIIIMGNEGKGISPEVAELVTKKLNIPSFPAGTITSESLNVGIATAITVSEFIRRI